MFGGVAYLLLVAARTAARGNGYVMPLHLRTLVVDDGHLSAIGGACDGRIRRSDGNDYRRHHRIGIEEGVGKLYDWYRTSIGR